MGYRVKRIEALEKKVNQLTEDNEKLDAERAYWHRQAIIQAAAAGEEKIIKACNGWIPVSERLPEVFDYVLVTSTAGGRTIAHRVPNQTNWYDFHSTVVETGVIAWQPLPEPYKEDINGRI